MVVAGEEERGFGGGAGGRCGGFVCGAQLGYFAGHGVGGSLQPD